MTEIADLEGLGPKSQRMLAAAGIDTVEKLRELGSVRAYVMAKRATGNVSLNLLWALEGALTGEKWQVVAKTRRVGLLLDVEDVEREINGFESDR